MNNNIYYDFWVLFIGCQDYAVHLQFYFASFLCWWLLCCYDSIQL